MIQVVQPLGSESPGSGGALSAGAMPLSTAFGTPVVETAPDLAKYVKQPITHTHG